ncbi:MAG TPA: hypothetical protein VMO26_24610 [Vicinamibacterales bacterium]|nr:hypothetical protein [Vicinamibacterales bacterium]
MRELFLAFLAQHDDAGWLRVVDRIDPSIHPVDRAATRIWFHPACTTVATGPVSIVIPPWNGLVGRLLTRVNAGTSSSR